MATFLKIVAVIYLVLIWLAFLLVFTQPMATEMYSGLPLRFTALPIAITLSIPAAVLFAFGQLVGDIRVMRNESRAQSDHLRAMRAYYEPRRV